MTDAFRSLTWSLQGRFVNKSSNIKNIHLRTENTGGLCGVFDKTETQRWNKFHMHNCHVTMRSICCQGNKSLVPVSRLVIGDCSNITQHFVWYDTCCVGMVTDHVKRHDQNLRGRRIFFFPIVKGNKPEILSRDQTQVECWSWHTSHCMLNGDPLITIRLRFQDILSFITECNPGIKLVHIFRIQLGGGLF